MSAPFDDIRSLVAALPEPDLAARAEVQARLVQLEPGLGRLAELAGWLAGWQGRARPQLNRPIVALYAAAHADGPADAKARLQVLTAGGGAISAAARAFGAGVEVFDLAVDRPVRDMALTAAMGERECAATMAFGMEALAKTPDLLVLSDATPGAARAAATLALALYGGEARDWAEAPDLAWSASAVQRATAEGLSDPLQALRQLGGRETAALAGAILAARTQKVPVLLDGYAAWAAAAVLQALEPSALDHCMAASAPVQPGLARLQEKLGKPALLDLPMAAGEGLGGVAAVPLLRLACELAGG